MNYICFRFFLNQPEIFTIQHIYIYIYIDKDPTKIIKYFIISMLVL